MNEQKAFRLADYARSFATRFKGAEVFQHLMEYDTVSQGEELIVDWSGVRAASPSFMDEFLGRCCEAFTPTSRLVFILDDTYMIEMLDEILRRRDCQVVCISPPGSKSSFQRTLGQPVKAAVA